MTQGNNPQKSSSSIVAIKPKATAGLRKFVMQDEHHGIERSVMRTSIFVVQQNQAIRRHDHAFVEVIMYKKDVDKVGKAINK